MTEVEGCDALDISNFDGKIAAAPAAMEPNRTLRRVIMVGSLRARNESEIIRGAAYHINFDVTCQARGVSQYSGCKIRAASKEGRMNRDAN